MSNSRGALHQSSAAHGFIPMKSIVDDAVGHSYVPCHTHSEERFSLLPNPCVKFGSVGETSGENQAPGAATRLNRATKASPGLSMVLKHNPAAEA